MNVVTIMVRALENTGFLGKNKGLLKNGHLKMSKIQNLNAYREFKMQIFDFLLGDTIRIGC